MDVNLHAEFNDIDCAMNIWVWCAGNEISQKQNPKLVAALNRTVAIECPKLEIPWFSKGVLENEFPVFFTGYAICKYFCYHSFSIENLSYRAAVILSEIWLVNSFPV